MPANPFDFEDPERFEAVEMPVEPDIVYVLGVRLERVDAFSWACPHGSRWAQTAEKAALSCLRIHVSASSYPDDAEAYALDDPKHPTFHERYADRADMDRKRMKGE